MEISVPFLIRYLYRNPKLLLLSIVSGLSVSLWVMRVVHMHDPNYFFMLWNLFLALLPVAVAEVLWELDRAGRLPGWLRLAGLGLWLVLMPNAPYMITDLMHLGGAAKSTIWFDSMMMFCFAMTGLLSGTYSWYVIHRLVRKNHGTLLAWVGVGASGLLISFGVYLGRFGRWNSWDLLTHPLGLGRAIWQSTHDPLAQKLTISFTFVLLLVYVAFYSYFELRKYEVLMMNDK